MPKLTFIGHAAFLLEDDRGNTVAIDPLFGLGTHRTLMTTPVTRPEIRDGAHALLAKAAEAVTVIHDSPGFIAQRVIASIVAPKMLSRSMSSTSTTSCRTIFVRVSYPPRHRSAIDEPRHQPDHGTECRRSPETMDWPGYRNRWELPSTN